MILSWLWQPVVVAGLLACLGLALKAPTTVYLAGVQGAVEARRECSKRVLDILALCSRLEGVSADDGALRPRLQSERDRWEDQLGEATLWLADNWQQYALTYMGARGTRDTMVQYAGKARGVWLSSRPLDEKVRELSDLTGPIQDIYFASWWHVMAKGRAAQAVRSKPSQ